MVPFVFLKAIELDNFSHFNAPVHFHFTLFVFLVSGRLRFAEDPFFSDGHERSVLPFSETASAVFPRYVLEDFPTRGLSWSPLLSFYRSSPACGIGIAVGTFIS